MQDFIGGFSVNLSESDIDPEESKELESKEPQSMCIANDEIVTNFSDINDWTQ